MPHLTGEPSAAYGLTAIAIALQHPALSTDPGIMCAAASTCTEWRAAVQQCGACNTHVTLDFVSLLQLSSFARWLPKHPQLVRSISFEAAYGIASCCPKDAAARDQAMHVCMQLLQQAMQLATLLPAVSRLQLTDSLAAAAVSSTQGTHAALQQQQLRLTSFSGRSTDTLSMLAVLPAHSLTALDISLFHSTAINGPAMSAALAQLSSLQQLSIASHNIFSGDCFSGLAQLKQLTLLKMNMTDGWAEQEQSLQQLLQLPLPLRQLRLYFRSHDEFPRLDMSAQTQLQQLYTEPHYVEGVVLPANLLRLRLEDWRGSADLAAISNLQKLQSIKMYVTGGDAEPLLRLAQLPALKHLVLQCLTPPVAADMSQTWGQLSSLQELDLGFFGSFSSLQDMQRILAGLAAATSLTKLWLGVRVQAAVNEDLHGDVAVQDGWVAVAACSSLAALTSLKELMILPRSYLVPGDALALTALTGLTHLDLQDSHDGVGDLEATAIACSCKQLQHLDLRGCDLAAMTCAAAIGHLTQLTQLQLQGDYGLTERRLMLLTGLRQLQEFELQADYPLSDEVIARFWAALRRC